MDKSFYNQIKDELIKNILPYWQKYSQDKVNKGFYGEIDNNNKQDAEISRSIVMTSRFLWAYSAAARLTKDRSYLEMADFAYDVILTKFWDNQNSGVYWSVYPDGTPDVSKKQIYGEAFCIYGLSEYAAALRELKNDTSAARTAITKALELFCYLEKFAKDPKEGGYLEACAKDWQPTTDYLLSPKDMNCPKSMNTNLHVMEAYTTLYRVLPVVLSSDENIFHNKNAEQFRYSVGKSLASLVRITVSKILQPNAHLSMFFDMEWNLLSDEISYGHDIEASWLLWEAACELGDTKLQDEIRETVIKVAKVALEQGVDPKTGALENFVKNHGTVRDTTRVWWNQAEALNGFYNAWEMTKDSSYEQAVKAVWNWICNFQIDKLGGDWWASVDATGIPIVTEAKGGNWKTAYHNARACMELLRRSATL